MSSSLVNRKNFPMAASAIVLVLGLGSLAFGVPPFSIAPFGFPPLAQTASSNGICSNSGGTDLSTLFMFETSLGGPVSGVNVTAGGISQVTNSSGLAVVGGGNFTNFVVRYHGEAFRESLAGQYFPVVCSASSYYRIVSMSFTTTTVSGGSEDQ